MSLPGFFNTIILLGAIQGFIVTCLLFYSKNNRRSNRLLAALIFFISLASFNLYVNYVDWFSSPSLRFISQFVPLVIVMPIGPLIYFYIRSFLDPGLPVTKKERRHFYTIIIDFVPALTVIIFVVGVITGLIKNKPAPWGQFIDTYNVYADIPRWLSLTIYVWMSSKYLAAYKTKLNAALNGQAQDFKWLQQCIRVFIIFQAIWFLYLIPYVIPKYTDVMLNTFDWYPIYIPMAIIIYYLGIKGYIISQQTHVAVKRAANTNTALSSEIIVQSILLLKKSMEEDKLYLNHNLSLHILSQQTGVSQKIISAVLNQHVNKSFNEFVNEYRINAFKEKINNPEMERLTIAGIAFECGFNSQATFQRSFKQVTGMSPSEFRGYQH